MKYLSILLFIIGNYTAKAQTITGKWETYDDKTKAKTAVIEIYEEKDRYFGKIIKNVPFNPSAICDKCEGDKKNQPIVGLVIIENMLQKDNEYSDGTILDPETGTTYSCILKLVRNNQLKVRGFIGYSLFGRTQYWVRKN